MVTVFRLIGVTPGARSDRRRFVEAQRCSAGERPRTAGGRANPACSAASTSRMRSNRSPSGSAAPDALKRSASAARLQYPARALRGTTRRRLIQRLAALGLLGVNTRHSSCGRSATATRPAPFQVDQSDCRRRSRSQAGHDGNRNANSSPVYAPPLTATTMYCRPSIM